MLTAISKSNNQTNMFTKWLLRHYPEYFLSQILLKHRNVSFILLICLILFLSHINLLDISQYMQPMCSSKLVITTFIIWNAIFLHISLLNVCMKVLRGGNLKNKITGLGWLNFVKLPFCLPKPESTWHTQ